MKTADQLKAEKREVLRLRVNRIVRDMHEGALTSDDYRGMLFRLIGYLEDQPRFVDALDRVAENVVRERQSKLAREFEQAQRLAH